MNVKVASSYTTWASRTVQYQSRIASGWAVWKTLWANLGLDISSPLAGSGGGGGERDGHLSDDLGVGDKSVARPEHDLGVTGPPDPGRRAREDQVAGQQWDDGGQRLDQVRDGEDKVVGSPFLHLLPVEDAADPDVVGI